MNWLIFAVIGFVLFGLWGVILKYATEKIDSAGFTLFQTISSLIVITIVFGALWFSKSDVLLTNEGIYLSLLAGAVGILAVLFEAMAYKLGDISAVGSFVAVGTAVVVVMGGVFLFKDSITPKIGIGILLGLVSIFLLSS